MAGGSDPQAARRKALADIRFAEEKAKIDTMTTALLGMAQSNAAALRARSTVDAADNAAKAAAQEEQAAQQPTDITQFFPQQQVNAASPQPGQPRSFGELFEQGGSANAIANRAVAPARQAAGTLPSAQPSAPQGGGGGMSVNVGGQQFSAPETLTTTTDTTQPLQFDAGFFAPATTRQVTTEPNALRAGDILAAQQRKQATIGTTLFELGREGVIGPDAVTAAMALDRGDYETYGRVLGKNPLLSEQVTRKRMDVQDAQIDAYRASAAQSYESTRGQRILNDMFVQQFSATAEGNGALSDNDIFGIPSPSAQSLGIPTSIRGGLTSAGGGGGGLTPNQVTDTLRGVKVGKDGKLDAGSTSALMALQGWGVQNRIAVFAAPKRGKVTDLMRSYGVGGDEVSHVQMVPMDEMIGTVLAADGGNAEAIAKVTKEWGLFEPDGEGGINSLSTGPNAPLSRGLVRKLQMIVDARGYGGDPQMAPPEVPSSEAPTPDALDAEADVELERTKIKSLLTNQRLSEAQKTELRARLSALSGPDPGVAALRKGLSATKEAFGRARERARAGEKEAAAYLGTGR